MRKNSQILTSAVQKHERVQYTKIYIDIKIMDTEIYDINAQHQKTLDIRKYIQPHHKTYFTNNPRSTDLETRDADHDSKVEYLENLLQN